MGVGDIEIGSRLGYPSKYQNRPRARRNHITVSLAMFHTPKYDHVGEIPPSFDGTTQKQNARGRGGAQAWGGGYSWSVFAHARPTPAALW
jgi:hypothetical protein